jgi:hypothetical protein
MGGRRSQSRKSWACDLAFLFRSATTCFLSNSGPSGRRDNFAAFGVEGMLDSFTRVFIILNEQDAGNSFSPSLFRLFDAT